MSGWIKIHRKLLDNPRFKDGDWLKVWVWMLATATHKPYDVLFKGQRTKLQPGQFTAGRIQIAQETGVAQAKVWRIVEALKSEQQIEQQPSNACSLFTILNWDKYQHDEQQSEQPVSSHRATTEQPVSTKQEQKNIRMEEVIYEAYPLKVGKPKALASIQKALKKVSFEILLAKTQEFAGIIGDDKQFVPHPTTWFNQERWNDNDVVRLQRSQRQPELLATVAAPSTKPIEAMTQEERLRELFIRGAM